MFKCALTILFLSFIIVTKADPLWMRYPKISPDGKQIAFSYKGDIYTVDVNGGAANQLTTHSAYDSYPIWSPDGKSIAFASDRHGNLDIFIMSSQGGNVKRVTTHSTREIPYSFTPDGNEIIYGAQIQDPVTSAAYPGRYLTELYAVSVDGGRPRQVLATPAEEIAYSKKGDFFIYQDLKGGENIWRKKHTSSVTRDIYKYDFNTKQHTLLTDWKGENRNPVLAPDQNTVYFLSEREGSFNIYSFELNNPRQVGQVTTFKNHPVRFLSIANNGTLCFGYDGEIYVKNPNGQPQKVNVQINSDFNINDVIQLTLTTGARSLEVSPDGKQMALIARGDVFVTSVEHSATKQITSTPEQEKWVSFSPDSRSLAYASERGGNWNIYIASIARNEEANFSHSTIINEEALFQDNEKERFAPQFSPDGKEIAFIEDRTKLMVINLENKKVRQIADDRYQYRTSDGFNYSWSPDGKWFVMEVINNQHDPYGDIAIVSSSGECEIINLTHTGYFESNPRWVLGGNAILFTTDRYGMRNHASWGSLADVMIIFLNQKSFDKFKLNKEQFELYTEEEKRVAVKDDDEKNKDIVEVDLRGIEDRILRLTSNSSDLGDALLSADGEKLYYMAKFEKGYDLWVADLRSRSTRILQKLGSNTSGSLQLDKNGKDLYLLSGGSSSKIVGDKRTPINWRAEMRLDRAAERAYMFDKVRLQEKKRFYVEDMHGVDWDWLCDEYQKFLPYINNNYDFSEMLSELLGELNVSHTGSGYRAPGGGDNTAELGIIIDFNYNKDGLLIQEIIEKGPFDNALSNAKAGDIIRKIDGKEIKAGMDYYPLLNNKSGKRTLVEIYNPTTRKTFEEIIVPINKTAQNNLLYARWIKCNAEKVKELSGGRLGYVHISSMDDDSFRKVYADILGKYNHCDGIVIDTRYNGGGRLHEDIEILFSGEKYFTQVIRGRESCDMPSRRYNKASIMLICEGNYSNAHGTPWVYKHKNMGKLVGMPVPGTMTSVTWETLQDPTLYFGIPVVGYRLADGSYLENQQLEPDVKVQNTFNKLIEGEDEQLRTAVEVLLQDLK